MRTHNAATYGLLAILRTGVVIGPGRISWRSVTKASPSQPCHRDRLTTYQGDAIIRQPGHLIACVCQISGAGADESCTASRPLIRLSDIDSPRWLRWRIQRFSIVTNRVPAQRVCPFEPPATEVCQRYFGDPTLTIPAASTRTSTTRLLGRLHTTGSSHLQNIGHDSGLFHPFRCPFPGVRDLTS